MGPGVILEAMTEIEALLSAAGVRAFVDSKELNPPAVLIQPPVFSYRFGKGCADAEWTLLAVAHSSDRASEIRALDALLADIRTALTGKGVTGRPAGVFTADGTATLPAYEITFTDKMEVTP